MATYYTFALKFDHHGSKMFKNQYTGGGRLLGTKEYASYPEAFDVLCKEGESIIKAF